MVDRLTPARRSWLMSRIGGKNTVPEVRVRQAAHSLGFRFRLHRSDLPGTPDLVFPKLRTVMFVHGCFWHRHTGCRKASNPGTRREYWTEKFHSNVERDHRAAKKLRATGWRVITVWQCETVDMDRLRELLLRRLGSGTVVRHFAKPARRRRKSLPRIRIKCRRKVASSSSDRPGCEP
jgi:DNA mismatch endonuclease, patch repair protein